MMRRLLYSNKILLLIIWFLITTITLSQSKSELINTKEKILKEIQLANEILESSKKEKFLSIEALQALTVSIQLRTDLKQNIIQQKDSIEVYRKEIEMEISHTESKRKDLIDSYKKLIKLTYFNEFETSFLYFLFSTDSFKEALDRYIYYKNQEMLRQQLIQGLDFFKNELLEFKNTLDSNLMLKNNLLQEVKLENDSLSILKTEHEMLKDKLIKKEGDLKEYISTKKEEAEKVEREIIIIQQKINHKNLELDKIGIEFVNKKGQIIWPVETGIIVGNFGEVFHKELPGIKIINNGIEIGVKKNSKARAVHAGGVSKIILLQNGLKAVILRHGSYLTVYSNLEKVYVQTGQAISEEDLIGLIFSKANETTGILGFQIWKGTDKMNPMNWINNNK